MFARNQSYLALLAIILVSQFLGGCASSSSKKDENTVGSFAADLCLNCAAIEPRKAPVQFLILHHTAAPLPSALDILQGKDPSHKVGIHYLVSDEPLARVFKFAPENFSTSHAGKSKWLNIKSMNQSSLGIEIVNLDGNSKPYPTSQITKVIEVALDIIKRYQIPPSNVLAHSDIAIGRKIDPGALFPWKLLAERGVGAWPDDIDVQRFSLIYKKNLPTREELFIMLKTYGYQPESNSAEALKQAIEALQRHFRGSRVSGVADTETVAILAALNFKYRTVVK